MRSITTSIFAGLLVAATSVSGMELASFLKSHGIRLAEDAKFTNQSIPFKEELDCAACIRGGYDFCIFRQFPNDTTHGMKRNCTSYPISPEINSVMNVNETDRWACSGAFLDQENAIINMCDPADSDNNHRLDLCGQYLIDLEGDNRNVSRSIANLPLLSSCTYRVHTKCGYPSMSIFSQQNISDEFDVSYTFYDDLTADQDINDWGFNSTSEQMGNLNTTTEAEKSVVVQSGNGVSADEYDKCTGKDRNLWVTFTRVSVNVPTPPEPTPNATLATSRLLKAGEDLSTLNVVFTTYKGDNAQWIRYSMAALVAALALFAF